MEREKVNKIGMSLDHFFTHHITPEKYSELIGWLHNRKEPESAKLLDILEGIRDLYLAYSGEDLANNIEAVLTYEDFSKMILEANNNGMNCADLCGKMGQEIKPYAEGMNIYVVKYGCIKAAIADTTNGIAILKPIKTKKMGKYIPLTETEIEAASTGNKKSGIPIIVVVKKEQMS